MASTARGGLAKTEEVYASEIFYRELGYYISRLEQFARALKFFDLAITKAPNDRRALSGRARARAMACQYEGALKDIRTALGLDPDDLVMLGHKALMTYLSCEFEDGLVQNTRLIPRRQKPDCFQMGAMHCANAIENCLGERAGRPLRDHFLIIRKLAWRKNFEEQIRFPAKSKKKKVKKEKKHDASNKMHVVPILRSSIYKNQKQRIPSNAELTIVDSIHSHKIEHNAEPPRLNFPYRPLQNHTTNIKNYMAEKYLDTLYKDKLFLKSMMKHPGKASPNEAGTSKIENLIKTGYHQVKYEQKLLRTRRPFYFIKYQETSSTGDLKIRQEQELNKVRIVAKQEADYLTDKMKEALENKTWFSVLEYAEKLKTFCKTPKKILPHREEYLHLIYDTVCQAHYDLKRLNPDQKEWETEKRIYKLLGLQLSREPSTDSVIVQFAEVFVDWKKQISVYNDRLRKATTSRELCWLFYELSRFHIELKQYNVARAYARQCINEAKLIGKPKWVINSLMLTMRINLAQHSKNDAKREATEAIELARRIQDDKMVAFFTKCRDIIDNLSFDAQHAKRVLAIREKKICDMMAGDQMKNEAEYLFKVMATLPANRRMSVLPGVVPDDTNKRIKSTRSISVAPNIKWNDGDLAVKKSSADSKGSKGTLSLATINIDR